MQNISLLVVARVHNKLLVAVIITNICGKEVTTRMWCNDISYMYTSTFLVLATVMM